MDGWHPCTHDAKTSNRTPIIIETDGTAKKSCHDIRMKDSRRHRCCQGSYICTRADYVRIVRVCLCAPLCTYGCELRTIIPEVLLRIVRAELSCPNQQQQQYNEGRCLRWLARRPVRRAPPSRGPLRGGPRTGTLMLDGQRAPPAEKGSSHWRRKT